MSQRNLIIITKIILFYSVFVVLMKLIFIGKQYFGISNETEEEVLLPLIWIQFLLIIPYLGLGFVAFFQNKKKQYSWLFVFIASVIIIAIRIYELEMVRYLEDFFRS